MTLKKKLFKRLVKENELAKNKYVAFKANKDRTKPEKAIYIAYAILTSLHGYKKRKSEKRNVLSESQRLERKTVFALVRLMRKYDVVSFDIFDTLIFRSISDPLDLFLIVGRKLKLVDFYLIRQKMEAKARDIAEQKTGSREVKLIDIYRQIEKYTGIDAEYGAKIEFETELEFCFANPYMMATFEILKNCGKEMIATSDMYLPKEMIQKLLEACGYTGFSDIFVSCEYGISKRKHGLYEIILKQHAGKSLIHIGDNHSVDVVAARDCGIKPLFYNNVNKLGKSYRPYDMSPIIQSVYTGLVNSYIYNGLKTYNPHYEFGFIYGGIMMLGFILDLHKYAEKENIQKILFLARDGYIMKKVYDRLYGDDRSEYVYWSRNVAYKAAHKRFKYEIVRQYVTRRIEDEKAFSIEQVFLSMELAVLIPYLKEANIDKNALLDNEELAGRLVDFLLRDDIWQKVYKQYSISTEAAKCYLTPIIGDAKHIAVVDTGYRGTGSMSLKYLVEEEWAMDCKVTGVMVATYKNLARSNAVDLLHKEMHSYLFSPMENGYNAQYQASNGMIKNACLEFITTAPHPSLIGFEKLGEHGFQFVFDRPEVENYRIIEDVHKGVMDFVDYYLEHTKNYPELLNITGHDAYAPFKRLLKNKFDYVKDIFGDFVYNQFVGGLEHVATVETFHEICVRKKISRL